MPRRKNPDGTAPPPKPRVRKKKEVVPPPIENKIESVYDAQMIPNGVGMMMDDSMYAPPQDYFYGGGPAPYGTPDPSSPYVSMPPQSSTPQPNPGTPNQHMMMRGMPGPAPSSSHPMGSQPMGAPSPLEYRLHDVNRRLYIFNNSGINEKDHVQWWDAFAHEFFDDQAQMTFILFDDQTNQPERYTIGRQLIPRYFRSVFDNGIKEMYYVVRAQSRETAVSSFVITFECDNVLLVTKHDRPPSEVQTECKFVIDFTPFDEMYNHRIRHWTIEMRHSQEYLFNELTKEYEPSPVPSDMDRKEMMRCGMPQLTLQYLRLCVVLEPMQTLMSHSKSHMITPKDSMRRVLFHFHQKQHQQQQMAMHAQMTQPGHMMPPAPEEPKPKPARKRQRKAPANSKAKKANASPAPTNPGFPPNPMHTAGVSFGGMGFQDVMVVGEPSMMGGDYGEEDERTISRVENTQYDPNALQMQQSMTGQLGPPGMPPGMPQGMVPGMGPGMGPGPPSSLAQLGGPPHPQQPQGQPFDYNGQPWRPPSGTMITG